MDMHLVIAGSASVVSMVAGAYWIVRIWTNDVQSLLLGLPETPSDVYARHTNIEQSSHATNKPAECEGLELTHVYFHYM